MQSFYRKSPPLLENLCEWTEAEYQKGRREKFWRATDNHGRQQAGEGNLEAMKRNRKQLRGRNSKKQRENNRKENKGKKKAMTEQNVSEEAWKRRKGEENEHFGKRWPI